MRLLKRVCFANVAKGQQRRGSQGLFRRRDVMWEGLKEGQTLMKGGGSEIFQENRSRAPVVEVHNRSSKS